MSIPIGPGYVLDRNFGRSLDKLDPRGQQRVKDALEKYGQNVEMPGLNLENSKGLPGRMGCRPFALRMNYACCYAAKVPYRCSCGRGTTMKSTASLRTGGSLRLTMESPALIATKPDAVDLGGSPQASRYTAGQRVPDNEPSVLEHWDTPNLAKVGFDEGRNPAATPRYPELAVRRLARHDGRES